MLGPDSVLEVAWEWVAKAESDLKTPGNHSESGT